MIIKVLTDNETNSEKYGVEHGLSLLLETDDKQILFDMGQSDLYRRNALVMGEDLSNVAFAVISHGHYDHGGGLPDFFEKQPDVPVYIRKNAFGEYCADRGNGKMSFIGLREPKDDVSKGQLVRTGKEHDLGDGMVLFSVPKGNWPEPSGNRVLFEKLDDGRYVYDSFMHEQNLLIIRGGNSVLIAGCAHRGIINILEWVRKQYQVIPQTVIGGFHLNHVLDDPEVEDQRIREIAEYLCETGGMYYTGHCTGLSPYRKLHAIMGAQIAYAYAGSVLKINNKES